MAGGVSAYARNCTMWSAGAGGEVAAMKFLVTIEPGEDGMYVAECPAIPGCISQGATEEEALENIKDAIRQCLIVRTELGMPRQVTTREVEVMA